MKSSKDYQKKILVSHNIGNLYPSSLLSTNFKKNFSFFKIMFRNRYSETYLFSCCGTPIAEHCSRAGVRDLRSAEQMWPKRYFNAAREWLERSTSIPLIRMVLLSFMNNQGLLETLA